ncbi:hypothetical protein NN561_016380 [Cricetulus griseus]
MQRAGCPGYDIVQLGRCVGMRHPACVTVCDIIEKESSQRWILHGWSAGDTGGRRPQKPQGCAREDAAQTGLPNPGHASGRLGSPGNPGSPSKPPGTQSPPAAPSQSRPPGPIREKAEGSPGSRGRGYLEARGCNPVWVSVSTASAPSRRLDTAGVRGVRSSERSRPGGRGSGARGDGSGHGESRAEAETFPGAPDWGGGGYGAGVGGRLPVSKARPLQPRANH